MPFDDRTSDGSLAARSLSEQLRDLEAQLGHERDQENDLSLPRVARPAHLPTHLGRPIGLTRLDGFPRVSRLIGDPDAGAQQPGPPLSPSAAFRRSATVVGVGLLLLATTAIVPPLFLRHPMPVATQSEIPERLVTVARTERFAQSAQQLRDAAPGMVPAPSQFQALPVGMEAQPVLAQPAVAHRVQAALMQSTPARPTITLAVSNNETARLDLPTIVAGLGSAAAGSAVVIDGLPAGTRVSHGIPIARESWTIASADIASAVVFLPLDTPERLGLLVRVIAADSQELAANTLEIRVRRTTDVTGTKAPARDTAARYEPTAAVGEAALDAWFAPSSLKR